MTSIINALRLIVLTIFLIFSGKAIGQTAPKRLLGSFILEKKAYNYEFTMESMDSYTFVISAISDSDSLTAGNDGEAEDTSAGSHDMEFAFNEFTKEIFQRVFLEQMNIKYRKSGATVDEAASEVFFKIKARLDFIDDEPITAYFILRKDYIYSLLRNNSSNYYQGTLSRLLVRHYIHRVEAETDEGALKNISVYLVAPDSLKQLGVSPRKFLIFKNQFPISISGKFDYEKFSKINLYCYNCSGIDGLSRYIKLSDLAILDIVYENDKEDYSPSNRVFSATPSNPIVELKKERRSRILEIAAFTDFVGLDKNEPNGLIQFEVKRRININTKHRLLVRGKKNVELLSQIDLGEVYVSPSPKKTNADIEYDIRSRKDSTSIKTIVIPNKKFRSPYFNFLSYIEPKLLFSKLEENNRFLDSAKAVGGVIDPLSLYQFQLASFGLNLQILRFSFPQIKLQWNFLNTAVYWGRTRVALSTDTTGPSVALNTKNWEFGSNVTFRPDNRWGASLGFAYILPAIWNSEYQLTTKNGLFQYQFDSWLRTGDDGKLFFRYRWTFENKNRNSNFTQIQLGYSVNLFAGTSLPKETK
jgi:hypothetical protein